MSARADPRRAFPAWLLVLTFTLFTFATDDYVVAGVLPLLARDLAVSEAAAGQLVTVFSLVFAVASPVAAVVAARWPRRRVMALALAVFAAANLAAPLATTYGHLLALRVLAALAAAVVNPAAFAVTAACAPEHRQGRYLGLLTAGLTASTALGVPAGTWLGAAWGWRATFAAGGLCGLAALAALWRTLPEPPYEPAVRMRERLAPLARPALLLGLLAVAIAVAGNMLLATYLAPFLRGLSGVGPRTLAVVFVIVGVAGLAGSQAGGWAADRLGPPRALITGCGVFAAAMLALTACWLARPLALAPVLPLLAVWCAMAWWIPVPAAARLLTLAGHAGPQALALNGSAVYAGVATGGAVGGTLLNGAGPGALPATAAALALAAVATFALAARLSTRRPVATETGAGT